jgi:hypothetical protein
MSLTSIVARSDHPSFVTHSRDPKALTIGYGVVKPKVSFVIDYFSFFTFGELIVLLLHSVIEMFLQQLDVLLIL